MQPYSPPSQLGKVQAQTKRNATKGFITWMKAKAKRIKHSARQDAKREIQRQLMDSGPCQHANDAWWQEHALDVSSSLIAHLNREWEEAHEAAMESIRQQEYWDYEDERREYEIRQEYTDYDWRYKDSIL